MEFLLQLLAAVRALVEYVSAQWPAIVSAFFQILGALVTLKGILEKALPYVEAIIELLRGYKAAITGK